MIDGVIGAAEGKAALMAFDDALRYPETEAGAVEVFGGVEGIEDAGAHGGRHAVSCVGDGDADAVAALRVCGIILCVVSADDEAAALAHRVDGVGDKVIEHLADVVFKTQNARGGSVAGLDCDAGVGQAALIELEHWIDQVGRRNARGADSLAMEAQGLGSNLADAGELALGGVDVLL